MGILIGGLLGLAWLYFWLKGGWFAAVIGAGVMLTLANWAAAPGPTTLGWFVVLVVPWIPAMIRTSVTKQVHA